jgi:hypothetical protein
LAHQEESKGMVTELSFSLRSFPLFSFSKWGVWIFENLASYLDGLSGGFLLLMRPLQIFLGVFWFQSQCLKAVR